MESEVEVLSFGEDLGEATGNIRILIKKTNHEIKKKYTIPGRSGERSIQAFFR
jgi:hypothetical protein